MSTNYNTNLLSFLQAVVVLDMVCIVLYLRNTEARVRTELLRTALVVERPRGSTIRASCFVVVILTNVALQISHRCDDLKMYRDGGASQTGNLNDEGNLH
jgi:hypothetical protein